MVRAEMAGRRNKIVGAGRRGAREAIFAGDRGAMVE